MILVFVNVPKVNKGFSLSSAVNTHVQ